MVVASCEVFVAPLSDLSLQVGRVLGSLEWAETDRTGVGCVVASCQRYNMGKSLGKSVLVSCEGHFVWEVV